MRHCLPQFRCMAPGMIMTVQPFDHQPWMNLVPVLGQQMAIGGLLRGNGVGPVDFVVTTVVTLAACALCVAVTARLVRRERMLFGG